MNEVLLIAGMAAVTFGVRYPVLALFSRLTLPAWVMRALRFVPLAVLSAIIAPAMFIPEGTLISGVETGALFAGVVAALVAWRTKNLLLTIIIGMAALWGFRLLVNGF